MLVSKHELDIKTLSKPIIEGLTIVVAGRYYYDCMHDAQVAFVENKNGMGTFPKLLRSGVCLVVLCVIHCV